MTRTPEELIPTRRSLLDRLRNWDDQASWKDFFETYWKLIYGVGRKAGLTDAEAQDVVQETIISVARQMPDFRYDPALGSFKAWLMRLTRWRITDHFRKKQYGRDGRRFLREQAMDHSQLESLALENPAELVGFDLEAAWNEEWEKQLFESALAKVRQEINPIQFQMFHLHVCKNIPARQVAGRLGAKLPEVYFAKYKVSAAIKKKIRKMQDQML
jgi:RNA polymerase sigma factor (sigma-70 family)